jgi:hypothetical protein
MIEVQVGGHINNSKQMTALIDDDDVWVATIKWSLHQNEGSKTYYAKSKVINTTLHRAIMGLENHDTRQVNHINGNGLDNRRANLEICSNLWNAQGFNRRNGNIGSVKRDESHTGLKKFRARIRLGGIIYRHWVLTEAEGQQWISKKLTDYLRSNPDKLNNRPHRYEPTATTSGSDAVAT